MNHTQILQKTWRNVVSYRALWILGILLALTSFSGGWAYMIGPDEDYENDRGITVVRQDDETFWQAFKRTVDSEFAKADRELERLFDTEFGIDLQSDIKTYLLVFAGAILLLFVIGRIVRYVSETGLIHMVDRHEESGEQLSARQGLRLGWSRASWRLFLIDLIITVASTAAGITLFALILVPMALWVDSSETVIFIGAFSTASLILLAIVATIVFSGFVTMLRVMARRACVLENLTVGASIRRGYGLIRGNLKDMVLMGIVALGVNGLWPIAVGLSILVLLGAGLLVGALPAVIIANLSDPATLPAAILGSAFFFLLIAGPLVLLEGLLRVFFSSLWTLTYRQLRELETQTGTTAPAAPLPNSALPVPSA